MIEQNNIDDQLLQHHLHRNKNVWIYHILLALSSTFIQREKLMDSSYCWFALLIIFIGLAVRSFVFNFHPQDWLKQQKWAIICNYISLFILSSGWMAHFASIYHAYGPKDPHTSYGLIIIAGLVTGATVSLLAHSRSFILFASVMCFVPVIIFMSDPDSEKIIIFPILVFYFFNTYNFRIGHRQLRKSIENEMHARLEKDRIEKIIDTVPGFVGVLNKDGLVTMANKSTRERYPNILGVKVGNLDPTSDWEKEVLNVLNSDKATSISEHHSSMNSQDVWALMNTQKTEDGGVIYVAIVINELVTARKLLREQEAKAHYAAKLASLGEMAAGIAHEVNNPLTIIQGSAALIQKMIGRDGAIDTEKIRDLTSKLIQTTERISRTVKSLKNLSRSGENDPFEEIDLSDLINQCLEISKIRAEKAEIEIKMPVFDHPVVFSGREIQLAQVLINLISNSIDAVKNCSERWIELSYLDTPEALAIIVKDSGPGIPEDIRNKIMEPFFTTKEVNQGTGLGLSISKSIMLSHGGELILEKGKPTTFKMRLPKKR